MLAVIPARGGSKGIVFKNLKRLNGRTLLSYAIQLSLDMGFITVVTTDSPNVEKEAIRCGAIVRMVCDPYLHSDTCKSIDVWKDVWKYYDEEVSVLLEPTCPLRVYQDIERCINVIDDYTSVVTVSKAPPKNKLFTLNTGNKVISDMYPSRRQDSPQHYKVNGACYAMHKDHEGEIIENAYAVIIDRPLVSIDTEDDLDYARYLMDL
jgi:CMP-N-acetylneuraminic acid synthetase